MDAWRFVLLISRFATVSTGWNTMSSAIPDVADPSRRALADSLVFPAGVGDMVSFFPRSGFSALGLSWSLGSQKVLHVADGCGSLRLRGSPSSWLDTSRDYIYKGAPRCALASRNKCMCSCCGTLSWQTQVEERGECGNKASPHALASNKNELAALVGLPNQACLQGPVGPSLIQKEKRKTDQHRVPLRHQKEPRAHRRVSLLNSR